MAPFIFIIQFFSAKKLVILPHYSFNRLAAEVGDPSDCRLTFVNMTARCGSTLLSQMVSRTDKARTMSEPWSLVHAHGLFNTKKISMPEYKRLLRSIVRLQCKKEHGRHVDHIFIKTTMFMAPAFPLLMDLFPKAKYIFNTRQWKPSAESYMQLTQFQPLIVYYIGALFQVCSSQIALSFLQLIFDLPVLVGTSSNTIRRPFFPRLAQEMGRQQGQGLDAACQTVPRIRSPGMNSLKRFAISNVKKVTGFLNT